ncbi:MAG: hypothetical protein AB8B47_02865 [Roseobacter sp.]
MQDLHWAVFALRDIKSALNEEQYEIAAHHISDAIAAILSVEETDVDMRQAPVRDQHPGH